MKHQVLALLPLLIVTATVVAAMFAIAVRRSHALTAGVMIVGMNLALLSVLVSWATMQSESIAVTGLLIVDGPAQFAMAMMLITTLGVLTLCPAYFSGYRGHSEELYLLIGVGTLGALTLACANHAATILLGLELLSLPMVGAVAYPIDRPRAIEGGVKYLVLSGGASATLLFGLALIYAQIGALDVASLATAIASIGHGSPLVAIGTAMLLAGLAFKLSFVPFHQWTPDVYEAAPLPVTAYLSTVVKLGAFVVALRLLHAGVETASPWVVTAIVGLALASMLLGSVLAIRQTNLKRLLAYSSIANFGYLAVVLALPGHAAVRAAGVFLVSYLVTTLGVFGVMTLVSSPMGHRDHENHRRIPRSVLASAVSGRATDHDVAIAGRHSADGRFRRQTRGNRCRRAGRPMVAGRRRRHRKRHRCLLLPACDQRVAHPHHFRDRRRCRDTAVGVQGERRDAVGRNHRHRLARRLPTALVRTRPIPRVSVKGSECEHCVLPFV